YFTHVVAHPFLEDIDQKAAVLLCAHGAFGDEIAALRVEQSLAARGLAPALVRELERLRGGAFDDRNELHPFGAQLVAEETIDLAPAFLVGGVDRAQDIEFNTVPAQLPPSLHDAIEGTLLAAVDTVGVVQLSRPVDAQPHKK